MCSDDEYTMTDCGAYRKHVFKSQSRDQAHNETEHETIATTDHVYDTVNIQETGCEAITTTDTAGYEVITFTDNKI